MSAERSWHEIFLIYESSYKKRSEILLSLGLCFEIRKMRAKLSQNISWNKSRKVKTHDRCVPRCVAKTCPSGFRKKGHRNSAASDFSFFPFFPFFPAHFSGVNKSARERIGRQNLSQKVPSKKGSLRVIFSPTSYRENAPSKSANFEGRHSGGHLLCRPLLFTSEFSTKKNGETPFARPFFAKLRVQGRQFWKCSGGFNSLELYGLEGPSCTLRGEFQEKL